MTWNWYLAITAAIAVTSCLAALKLEPKPSFEDNNFLLEGVCWILTVGSSIAFVLGVLTKVVFGLGG
jgi:hypothetical protein